MNFETRPSQCIDTYVPNSEASIKQQPAPYKQQQLEDRKSSFLGKNSQSININSDLNVVNQQPFSSVEREVPEKIKKRLQTENDGLLNEFAKIYIFAQDKKIDLKSPSEDLLRTRVKYVREINTKFIGEVNEEMSTKDGKGILIYRDGSYYFGDFVNGQKQGYGVQVYKNQERYEGQFNNDEKNGKGTQNYQNGDQYFGYFENGLKHGQGKMMYYEQCATFIGSYVNDKKEGQGLIINFNGRVIQEGIFKEDKYHSSNSNRGSFKSGQSSRFQSISKITNDQVEKLSEFKNEASQKIVEQNQIELLQSNIKISKELPSPQQQSFTFTTERKDTANSCCCTLIPQSISNFFGF